MMSSMLNFKREKKGNFWQDMKENINSGKMISQIQDFQLHRNILQKTQKLLLYDLKSSWNKILFTSQLANF